MILSIIIPIYNSERFLKNCIDSIYSQEISECNFELILVDDGSSDSSFQICETRKKEHSNIVLCKKENGGQATARNLGIRMAQGKYIMFVDSDDILLSHTIPELLRIAEEKESEITISSMRVYNQIGQSISCNDYPYFNKIVSGEEAILHGLNFGSVCARLFRRDFLDKNNITFTEGIKHEDVLFSIKSAIVARKVTSVDMCTYEYRWVEGSTDRSSKLSQKIKAIFSDLEIAGEEKQMSLDKGLSKELRLRLNRCCNSLVVSNIIQLAKVCNKFHEVIPMYISVARRKKILPFEGAALSWRSTFICKFLNLLIKII